MAVHADKSRSPAAKRTEAPRTRPSPPQRAPVQLKEGEEPRPEAPPRGALGVLASAGAALAVQRAEAPNRTGLPDRLKAGIEAQSGLAMDDVRVHRNSPEPAKLGALAYAQGNDIHLGPAQERHLPHEAWHVVQQKQGRVSPTRQTNSASLNDDAGLEAEADRMGSIIDREKIGTGRPGALRASSSGISATATQLQQDKGLTDERTWETEIQKTTTIKRGSFTVQFAASSRCLIEYMPGTPVKVTLVEAKHKTLQALLDPKIAHQTNLITAILIDQMSTPEFKAKFEKLGTPVTETIGILKFEITIWSLSPVVAVAKVTSEKEIWLDLGNDFHSLSVTDYQITIVGH